MISIISVIALALSFSALMLSLIVKDFDSVKIPKVTLMYPNIFATDVSFYF